MPQMAALPVIDFSAFTGPGSDADRAAVAAQTHKAFSEVGFCYAVGHGVPPALLARVFAAAERLFALPEAEKDRIAVERSPSRSRGFQRLGQNVTQGANDAHEGFDTMRELPRDHRLVAGEAAIHHADQNLWPEAEPDLRGVMDEYVDAMSAAGAAIMEAVAMGLGLAPKFFEKFYAEGFWIQRLISYPEEPEPAAAAAGDAELEIGCGEHTDYGCLTMVVSDSTPGCLQVRGTDGDCEKRLITTHLASSIG